MRSVFTLFAIFAHVLNSQFFYDLDHVPDDCCCPDHSVAVWLVLFHIAGALIHLLVVVAVIALIVHLIRRI